MADLIPWSDAYYLVSDRVATEDPKMPEHIVLSYIQRGFTELAAKAENMRVRVNIDLQAGVDEYPLEFDDHYKLVTVLEASCECVSQLPMAPRMAMRYSDHGYYVEDGWLKLSCCPECDIPNGFEALCSIKPGRKSCGVPEDYLEDNAEAVVNFVMWKIHSTRSLLYDPGLASKEERAFRYAISEATDRAESGQTSYHLTDRYARLYSTPRRRRR